MRPFRLAAEICFLRHPDIVTPEADIYCHRVAKAGKTPRPGNLKPAERARGATDRSVTPREEMVELRGLEPLASRLPERVEDHKL